MANAENLRHQTERDKEKAHQLAIRRFAIDLLTISDILETAISTVPESAISSATKADAPVDPKSANVSAEESHQRILKDLHVGVVMTSKELTRAFKLHGLEPYSAHGEIFDPNLHQAMFQMPMEAKPSGTVVEVLKKGYKLHGVVIRAAQVGVVQ